MQYVMVRTAANGAWFRTRELIQGDPKIHYSMVQPNRLDCALRSARERQVLASVFMQVRKSGFSDRVSQERDAGHCEMILLRSRYYGSSWARGNIEFRFYECTR